MVDFGGLLVKSVLLTATGFLSCGTLEKVQPSVTYGSSDLFCYLSLNSFDDPLKSSGLENCPHISPQTTYMKTQTNPETSISYTEMGAVLLTFIRTWTRSWTSKTNQGKFSCSLKCSLAQNQFHFIPLNKYEKRGVKYWFGKTQDYSLVGFPISLG